MAGLIIYLLDGLKFNYVFVVFFAATIGIQLGIFLKEAVTSIINNLIALIVMRKQVRSYRDIKGE